MRLHTANLDRVASRLEEQRVQGEQDRLRLAEVIKKGLEAQQLRQSDVEARLHAEVKQQVQEITRFVQSDRQARELFEAECRSSLALHLA